MTLLCIHIHQESRRLAEVYSAARRAETRKRAAGSTSLDAISSVAATSPTATAAAAVAAASSAAASAAAAASNLAAGGGANSSEPRRLPVDSGLSTYNTKAQYIISRIVELRQQAEAAAMAYAAAGMRATGPLPRPVQVRTYVGHFHS